MIHSSGPNLWLKFHSDNTIEYVGFQIQIDFIEAAKSREYFSNVSGGLFEAQRAKLLFAPTQIAQSNDITRHSSTDMHEI